MTWLMIFLCIVLCAAMLTRVHWFVAAISGLVVWCLIIAFFTLLIVDNMK